MMDVYFKDVIENKKILMALDDMGYKKATAVQKKVLPLVKEGRDIIVNSKTGSGKTAAFGIPIVSELTGGEREISALILTPTRELAIQVDQEIADISKYIDYSSTCVYGQHNMSTEINILYRGVSVVCGTPGRVLDHLRTGTMDLSSLKYLVLDEADRMLDMGFIDQIQNILEFVPKERQTMMFSATIPFDLENVCLRYMKDPVTVKIESETMTVDKIKQKYYKVEPREKMLAIKKLIYEYKPKSLIIFCNTRWQVDRISDYLNKGGIKAKGIHGGISQSGRIRSMNHFKSGKFKVLVATDVAARGIHVDSLEMVINFDIPDDYDSYVHRIGRTGRAGKDGIAISLISSDKQYALYEIEEHIGVMIEEGEFKKKIDKPKNKKVTEKNNSKKKNNHKTKTANSEKSNKTKTTQSKKEKIKSDNKHSSTVKKREPSVKKSNDKEFEFVFKFNDETYDNLNAVKPEQNVTKKSHKVTTNTGSDKKKKGFFAKLFGR